MIYLTILGVLAASVRAGSGPEWDKVKLYRNATKLRRNLPKTDSPEDAETLRKMTSHAANLMCYGWKVIRGIPAIRKSASEASSTWYRKDNGDYIMALEDIKNPEIKAGIKSWGFHPLITVYLSELLDVVNAIEPKSDKSPVNISIDGYSIGANFAAQLVSAIHWKGTLKEGTQSPFFSNPYRAFTKPFKPALEQAQQKIAKGQVEITCHAYNTFVWPRGKREETHEFYTDRLWTFVGSPSSECIPVTEGKCRYYFYNIKGDDLSEHLGKVLNLSEAREPSYRSNRIFETISHNTSESCLFYELKPTRGFPPHGINNFITPSTFVEAASPVDRNASYKKFDDGHDLNESGKTSFRSDHWRLELEPRFPPRISDDKLKIIQKGLKEKRDKYVKESKKLRELETLLMKKLAEMSDPELENAVVG